MSSQVKKTAFIGVFTALSIVVSILEGLFPMPVPGLKLGVANIVTVYLLYNTDAKGAYASLLCRCVVCSVLFGSVTSFAFSLCGGLMSLTLSAIIKKYGRDRFSYIGVCILGAAAHNTAQVAVCCLMLGSSVPISYLPILLICSVACGVVTGCVLNFMPDREVLWQNISQK